MALGKWYLQIQFHFKIWQTWGMLIGMFMIQSESATTGVGKKSSVNSGNYRLLLKGMGNV